MSIVNEVYTSAELNTSGSIDFRAYNDNIYHYYWDHYYPVYYESIRYEKSKIEQAFKIVDVLLKRKLVKITTVKQFVDLVNEISGVI